MQPPPDPERRSAGQLVRHELTEIFAPRASDRPWQLPFAIALAAGLPMVIGAWFGAISFGALASIGAMTIVYLPRTKLDQRMVAIMATACAMIACYGLGQIGQLVPSLQVPVIVFTTLLATIGCRYYRVGPPGPLFFVMAASIGAFAPGNLAELPEKLGIFALGSLCAVGIAFFYTLHILRHRDPLPLESPPDDKLSDVVVPSVIIAAFVGLSLASAQVFGFEKPYWVPISCIAVLQGITLRAVWHRQIQRIVGTFVGLGLTWILVRYLQTPVQLALATGVLLFLVEVIIVRHYALAAVFITPLAIVLAEASILGHTSATPLLQARLADTVLGSVLGLAGGYCLHQPALNAWLGRNLARLAPHR